MFRRISSPKLPKSAALITARYGSHSQTTGRQVCVCVRRQLERIRAAYSSPPTSCYLLGESPEMGCLDGFIARAINGKFKI